MVLSMTVQGRVNGPTAPARLLRFHTTVRISICTQQESVRGDFVWARTILPQTTRRSSGEAEAAAAVARTAAGTSPAAAARTAAHTPAARTAAGTSAAAARTATRTPAAAEAARTAGAGGGGGSARPSRAPRMGPSGGTLTCQVRSEDTSASPEDTRHDDEQESVGQPVRILSENKMLLGLRKEGMQRDSARARASRRQNNIRGRSEEHGDHE